MSSGYVLNFSNRTFEEFLLDITGRDIYDPKYEYGSGSKANRLRAFWAKESNHTVGTLVRAMIEYDLELREETPQHVKGLRIAERLLQESPVQELDAIEPNATEADFEMLARSVRKAIETDEPEAGLDRLHTFVSRYVRVQATAHMIVVDREKPLHSVFGEYVKALRAKGLIESDMTDRILRSTISILEAFNHVRNNQSFAHDNPVLGYEEALLIYNHIAASLRFLASLEKKSKSAGTGGVIEDDFGNLPF